jgi:hypothetical protein
MPNQVSHTPGPWSVADTEIVSDARYVAKVYDWSSDKATAYPEINAALKEESKANARLIAASPKMLDALQLSRGNVSSMNDTHPNIWGEWLKVLDEAIAEAGGAL